MSVRSRKKTHTSNTHIIFIFILPFVTFCSLHMPNVHDFKFWVWKATFIIFVRFNSLFFSLSFFHDHPPKKTYRVSMPNSVPKTVYISSFLFYYFFIFLQFFRAVYIILLFVICVIVYQIQKTTTTTTSTTIFEACTNEIYGRKWSDGCLCVSAFRMFVSVHTLMLAVLESEIEPNERREKVSNTTKHSTETL